MGTPLLFRVGAGSIRLVHRACHPFFSRGVFGERYVPKHAGSILAFPRIRGRLSSGIN